MKPRRTTNRRTQARHQRTSDRKSGAQGSRGKRRDTQGRRSGGRSGARWGRATDVYTDADYNGGFLDAGDPNYDSEEDGQGLYFVGSGQTGTHGYDNTATKVSMDRHVAEPTSHMTLSEYKRSIIALLQEYFTSFDMAEVERSLVELWCPHFHYEFVKRTITIAVDMSARCCEAASQLLSHLFGQRILTAAHVGKGFERLFEVADDLQVDVPMAPRYLAQFVARAVVDELLPPRYLMNERIAALGGNIVQNARTLLSMKHAPSRVERVWGPGASEYAEDLKRTIKMICAEFLDNTDLEETALSLRMLEAPRYMHEFVKRLLVMSLDRSPELHERVSDLFEFLADSGLLSLSQLKMGFVRVRDQMADLTLDTPAAPEVFAAFISRATERGMLEM